MDFVALANKHIDLHLTPWNMYTTQSHGVYAVAIADPGNDPGGSPSHASTNMLNNDSQLMAVKDPEHIFKECRASLKSC